MFSIHNFLCSWHSNSMVENLKELFPFSNYKYLLLNRRLSNWTRMSDRTPSGSHSAIRNFPIQRKISSHQMVLLAVKHGALSFERSTPSKVFSRKWPSFPMSCFNVKNSITFGDVTNPLSPVKAKKSRQH